MRPSNERNQDRGGGYGGRLVRVRNAESCMTNAFAEVSSKTKEAWLKAISDRVRGQKVQHWLDESGENGHCWSATAEW